jgi:hypothetical protein
MTLATRSLWQRSKALATTTPRQRSEDIPIHSSTVACVDLESSPSSSSVVRRGRYICTKQPMSASKHGNATSGTPAGRNAARTNTFARTCNAKTFASTVDNAAALLTNALADPVRESVLMNLELAMRQANYSRGFSVPSLNAEEDARLAEQALTFPITKLPYAGEKQCLRFDRRNHRPVKGSLSKRLAAAELSYSDYLNGLHIQGRATADEMRLLYTPEFSKNDEQLKLVVAQQAYDYVKASHPGTKHFYNSERVPNGFVLNREALEDLAKKATDTRKAYNPKGQKINLYRHISWCEAHGGYVAMRASIAYRAWRLAKDAHTIGNEMGISWTAVRQILHRMCKTARRLELATFPRHPSAQLAEVVRPYKDLNGAAA